MLLFPEEILEKLEYNKIIEIAATYCKGQKAKDILLNAKLFTSPKKIDALLTEIVELKKILDNGLSVPLRAYEAINDDLYWMRKIDFIPELESIHRVYSQIWSIFELHQFFDNSDITTRFPNLTSIMAQVSFDTELIKKYHKIFDEEGNVKPSASKELLSIHQLIEAKKRELDRTFNSIAKSLSQDGLLKDNIETLRGGRRVLAVPAEHKRKIKGIIHDESSTGKTVFIEPESVLHINNELYELAAKRRHEVSKIINSLVSFLRPFIEDFELWQRIIVRFDVIICKAKLAQLYDGAKPEILSDSTFDIKDGRHPLLQIINTEIHKKVVPFNLTLDATNRILVISGPNAGGKSVTMKSVGLLFLMLQAGLLVPVSPDSKMGLFKQIFVDIGDQQSLEDDLSTYSSHLTNMSSFLNKVGSRSLFLIDEFGSGTDPKMGGAIAESILDELRKKQGIGVVTTHYSNLKMYAFKKSGLINGAMLFDKENLKPTYRLSIGKPGSSFAFEIAAKSGLDKKILGYAKNKSGVNNKAVDQLLIELQEDKRILEAKLSANEKEKKNLERLIKSYEGAFGDLEVKRKRMKMERKEMQLKDMGQVNIELKELIKELKEKQSLEKAQKLAQSLKKDRESVLHQIEEIKDEVYKDEGFDPSNFKVGDFVRIRSGDQEGEILAIEKGKATLSMGILNVTTPLKELVPANQPIEINRGKSINTSRVHTSISLETKIDIREYRMDDAMHFLQEFLDNALVSNLPEIKIIHGKGNGIKRKAVLKKLKEYRDITKVWHPEDAEGGNGVTFASFH